MVRIILCSILWSMLSFESTLPMETDGKKVYSMECLTVVLSASTVLLSAVLISRAATSPARLKSGFAGLGLDSSNYSSWAWTWLGLATCWIWTWLGFVSCRTCTWTWLTKCRTCCSPANSKQVVCFSVEWSEVLVTTSSVFLFGMIWSTNINK